MEGGKDQCYVSLTAIRETGFLSTLLSLGFHSRGCWYLNTGNSRLGTLEGRNSDLSDDPRTRVNAVSKCGLQAQKENFKFFGIAFGYCISGSSRLSDYQYIRSRQCRDGRGAYNGNFIMDVYEIDDPQRFANLAAVNEIGMAPDLVDSMDSGSQRVTYGLMALLTSALIGLFSLFH